MANFDRLFPGAKLELVTNTGSEQTQADALLSVLSRPGLPEVLTTKWIGQQTGIPWRNMSKHVMAQASIVKAIENLGWKYVSGKGRKGSRFERLRNERDTDTAAVMPSTIIAMATLGRLLNTCATPGP